MSIQIIRVICFPIIHLWLKYLPRDSSRLARAARAIQIAWYVLSEAIPREKLQDFVVLVISVVHFLDTRPVISKNQFSV